MTSESRRGACPGVLDPMETGDGLLARLTPQARPLPPEAWLGLCAAARGCGNGIVEVTRRGNLQVRGLRPDSVAAFAEALVARGIDVSGGTPIQTGPLSGDDPDEALDVRPLARALRERLAAAPWKSRLGPKVSVVLDGGGALHLDRLDADLRLRAERAARGVELRVAVGGDATTAAELGRIAVEDAVDAAVALAQVLAGRGVETRARGLVQGEGVAPFTRSLGERLEPASAAAALRTPAEPVGTHRLRDGRVAIGLGLAFGQSDADALEALIRAAVAAGASHFAPAERHGLLALDVAPARVADLCRAAEDAGFLARHDDPRRHVAACSGAPACAAAQMPTRALGAALAAAAAPLLDGSIALHLSGCAKGCAHPGPAALTLLGVNGACGLVVADRARGELLATFESASLEARLARLARWVESAREPGEDSARVLARNGTGWVAHAMGRRNVA